MNDPIPYFIVGALIGGPIFALIVGARDEIKMWWRRRAERRERERWLR